VWLLCVERSKPIQHRDAPERSGATQYYQENACAFRPAENDPRRWWPPATQIECNDSEKSKRAPQRHESCVLFYLALVWVSVNRPSLCCVCATESGSLVLKTNSCVLCRSQHLVLSARCCYYAIIISYGPQPLSGTVPLSLIAHTAFLKQTQTACCGSKNDRNWRLKIFSSIHTLFISCIASPLGL
jgi:hypothetical protein